MNKIEISGQYANKVTTQDYSPSPKIDGVEFLDIKEFADCGGTFSELARLTDSKIEGGQKVDIRQINYSVLEPGAVKAFHLHYKQSEFWFVPPKERLLVGMIDARKGSPTEGNTMRFVMGVHKPRLLYIPAGVAHGVANPYSEKSSMIYFADQQFSLDKPDEQRLPWDTLGETFWEIAKG